MYYLYHYEWPGIQYYYKEDKLKVARSLGYKSIMECIVKEYWRVGAKHPGPLFGCSRTWATTLMKTYGFPVKGKGGPRYILKDLTGKKFGRLLVVRITKQVGDVIKEYEIRCDCGNVFKSSPYFRTRYNRCKNCRTKYIL